MTKYLWNRCPEKITVLATLFAWADYSNRSGGDKFIRFKHVKEACELFTHLTLQVQAQAHRVTGHKEQEIAQKIEEILNRPSGLMNSDGGIAKSRMDQQMPKNHGVKDLENAYKIVISRGTVFEVAGRGNSRVLYSYENYHRLRVKQGEPKWTNAETKESELVIKAIDDVTNKTGENK